MNAPAGYRSEGYMQSFGGIGQVRHLTNSRGNLISRKIPGAELSDFTGAYPLFCCENWDGLRQDVECLDESHVAIALVTDPFLRIEYSKLKKIFPVTRLFNNHYIVDLEKFTLSSRHHQRKLRSLSSIEINITPSGIEFLPQWMNLYSKLCEKKNINDLRKFSVDIFARQLAVPGGVVLSAWLGDVLLGADWYFQDNSVVYAHLSAYSDLGYKMSVSYPMMSKAIEFFSSRAQLLTLGGVPLSQSGGGLTYFKSGWSSFTAPTFLCGKITNKDAYLDLCVDVPANISYFPAYRHRDFTT